MKNKLVLIIAAVLFLLNNCSSIPTPASLDESLLVIICNRGADTSGSKNIGMVSGLRFQGPTSAAVGLDCQEWTIKTIKLKKGSYKIQFDGQTTVPFLETYNIKPHAVILFPYTFNLSSSGEISYLPVNGEGQQKAVQALINYIDFEQWLSSEYVGFGNNRPKIYLAQKSQSLTINTNPPGARIFLDNIEWGNTPKTIELSQGKYLLRLEKEGFTGIKRIISVDKNKEEYYTLEAIEKDAEPQKRETYNIMIFPFINIQDENYNPYGNIFLGTFKANFIKDKKLKIIQNSGDINTGNKTAYPDFALAIKNGAELVVAGKYQENNGQLLVHALLYDVQSGRIKYSVLYISEAGFSVFDSIDDISLNFSNAVSRVLPRPGNPILEQEGDVSAELSAYEKQLYKNRIIAKRCSRPHVLSLQSGLEMIADQIKSSGMSHSDLRNSPRTPLNFLKFEYEYILDPFISLSASLGAQAGACTAGDGDVFAMNINLFTGPKFYFRSSRSDIYIGALLSTSLAPAISVTESGSEYTFGPYFFIGALINSGIKIYFPAQLNETPYYLDTGIIFDAVTFRFKDFSSFLYVPMHMIIYVGMGMHL
jgi:TolB-like protein